MSTPHDTTQHDTTQHDAAPDDASATEWIVIRPAGELEFTELASPFEGEWRRRADLADESVVETLSPSGVVRAYPTDRVEESPAGFSGQVYEVPFAGAADDESTV